MNEKAEIVQNVQCSFYEPFLFMAFFTPKSFGGETRQIYTIARWAEIVVNKTVIVIM